MVPSKYTDVTAEIQYKHSLASLNTLGLPAIAEHYVCVRSDAEVCEALSLARSKSWPITILGGGSNVVIRDKLAGLVIHTLIPGISYRGACVEAGAGEVWHELVLSSLQQGLSGVENLALIPGSVGAAPIQNIGAYGAELKDVFESLKGIDRETLESVELSREDCRFGYRDSIFKHDLKERLVITRVRLRLHTGFEANLQYEPLRIWLEQSAGGDITARTVSDAVVAIRQSRLPDPQRVGNVGSFFKNPVVDEMVIERLRRNAPDLPCWHAATGSKVSAAWLIEQCGLKGHVAGRAAVSADHALVIINRGGATGEEILALATKIRSTVEARFGIRLDIEPVIY